MPVDPNIALSVQTPQPADPIQTFSRIEALKGALQQQQVQGAQLEGLNQENAMRAQQMRDMKATNDSYRSALSVDADGNASIDTGKLTRAMAGNGVGNQIPSVMKGINEYQKSVADLAEAHGKVVQLQTDALGNVGRTLQQSNYDPQLYLTMTQHAIDGKAIDPRAVQQQVQQVQQSLLQDPTGAQARTLVKGFADNAVSMSAKAQELLNQQKTAQGSADRGTAALANSQRTQGQQDLKDASAKLSQAKTPADYAAIWNQLPAGVARQFDTPEQFNPQTTPQKTLRVGMSPDQIAADARNTQTQQNTEAYRKAALAQGNQRIQIMQQNADTSEDRANKPTATSGNFATKEIDLARKQLDSVHQQRAAIGAALGTANGDQYVDPKTGKVSSEDMDDATRAKLQQQYQNVTNQGRRIIGQYGDSKSGGRILSNELPSAGGAQTPAPAPQSPVSNGKQPSAPVNNGSQPPAAPQQQGQRNIKVQVPGGWITGTPGQVKEYLAKKGMTLQ